MIDRGLLYQMFEGMLIKHLNCVLRHSKVYSYGYDLTEFFKELLELFRNAIIHTFPTTLSL